VGRDEGSGPSKESELGRPKAGFAGREANDEGLDQDVEEGAHGRTRGSCAGETMFPPRAPFFPEEGAHGGARGSPMSEPRGSPTLEELAELFEGRTAFVERLATETDPLVRARTLVHELPDDEKREVLDAHPAIGQRTGLSARSAAEQGSDDDPAVLDELARLNAAYEERHGFRFVVFVNRRPKAAILEVLRERIANPTDAELETALDELVAIAADRWVRG
jgi:2-oxo-4-hydroxy-4-carboxy--5-ureidoimidazoline (OHCU) decarboxylase